MAIIQALFGVSVLLAIATFFSTNRRAIPLRTVAIGILLQVAFAVFILKTSFGQMAFFGAQQLVEQFLNMADAGSKFVFGETYREHPFAFKALPTIIFVSAVMAGLFHLGVIQKLVEWSAWIMARTMKTSGSESLVVAANVFMGQSEAPLVIRPYIRDMTPSELFAMMASGMATVSGGILALYVGLGVSAGHLLAASIMSAPASLVMAKILFPETQLSPTAGSVRTSPIEQSRNFLESICDGAADGLKLALNVAAMVLTFIALVTLLNSVCSWATATAFGFAVSFEQALGWVFSLLAFCLGVEWADCVSVGQLLGSKIVVNELVAYLRLADLIRAAEISERSATIATYALCGFANFSSIAIQIGGIGNLVPERKREFATFGIRAMVGGALASFMTAAIAGVLVG